MAPFLLFPVAPRSVGTYPDARLSLFIQMHAPANRTRCLSQICPMIHDSPFHVATGSKKRQDYAISLDRDSNLSLPFPDFYSLYNFHQKSKLFRLACTPSADHSSSRMSEIDRNKIDDPIGDDRGRFDCICWRRGRRVGGTRPRARGTLAASSCGAHRVSTPTRRVASPNT